jgi:tetratricopeptide (TPR) repeat protein
MNTKKCKSCKTENPINAKFCSQCGEKFKEIRKPKKVEKQNEPVKKSNSFFILALALLFAFVTIFLVLDSNRRAFQEKVSSRLNQNPDPGQVAEQSPQAMQMMESVQKTKAALDQDPENYELNVQMANNYFDIGRFESAIGHYKTAIKKNASDANVLIDLGVSFFNTNHQDSALKYMDAALKINPTHPQGLYNVGIVHFSMGDSLEAINIWQKLVDTNSQSPQAQTAQKFLEQLKSKLKS